jgi:hypothetical protein
VALVTDTIPMPADPKLEPPLTDSVTLELLPVLEIVMLPLEEVAPWGDICTPNTSTPPELLPLTGVKLVNTRRRPGPIGDDGGGGTSLLARSRPEAREKGAAG